MKIADVNKLINLAERATKALEKIAKELGRKETIVLEKPMPKPKYGGGSL